ncbi:fibronectin type III domain-containing protein [Marinobacter nauticus]|uniref:fibronectin type III domain-containing protein n=3 Tax=Marinobacter nauticus TaxID=2743 RepID=UPI000EAD5243|nr:fibronectin type III domain-containing protein [Marinobacter nauticus]MBN8240988.1 fibronectin type III domain-containing protein [Marinobacter nauticus]MBW3199303.1 fibronectin type III domain-containing protein [Marinobacter nauticus]MBY6184719.1 fibronectin type III domain-containing protein [Marinobacter nauticus]TPW22436.1 fibronectin type III domain-containing protein [Marinobacter nauticus]
MKRVIYMSRAWIAALLVGMVLAGCGGGGSGGSESATQSGSLPNTGSSVGSAQPVAERSAVLSWSAPMTRVNGESIAMGELDRYVIRYGQDANDLSREITVDGASGEAEMSYVVDNLDAGTWYFTIQVQDTAGLLSEPSEPVSKTIQS